MDITRDWLKAGAAVNADNQVLETVMPLLHVCFLRFISHFASHHFFIFFCVIFHLPLTSCQMTLMARDGQIADRLPFTGETLVSSKIGKIVRKLAKDAPIPGEY